MSVIEDSLLAEIRNFLQDLTDDPEERLHFEVTDEARSLLEKLKGR